MKVIVLQLAEGGTTGYTVQAAYLDNSNNIIDPELLSFAVSGVADFPSIIALAETAILNYATLASYSITASDIIWGSVGAGAAVISTASHSIVTGTGATGFQVSVNRVASVNYSITIATTATIGAPASGTVVLEIAPTNSATAGDWVEIGRFTNGQSVGLAIALSSVQTMSGQVGGMVPAGYYAKIRSINNSGTPTYSYNSGQEILV